jgi:hypothetical protein
MDLSVCCLHLQRLGWWRVGFDDDVRGCGGGGGLCWKISDALDTSLVAILAKLSLEVGDDVLFWRASCAGICGDLRAFGGQPR